MKKKIARGSKNTQQKFININEQKNTTVLFPQELLQDLIKITKYRLLIKIADMSDSPVLPPLISARSASQPAMHKPTTIPSRASSRFQSPEIKPRKISKASKIENSPRMGSTIRGEIFPSMMTSFTNFDLKGSSPRLISKSDSKEKELPSEQSKYHNMATQSQDSFSLLDSSEKDGFFTTEPKTIWGEIKKIPPRKRENSRESNLLSKRLPYARCEFLLTKRTSWKVEQDLKTERLIARDVSMIMEPIMEENIQKVKTVDQRQLRRSHSVKVTHRSRFEEEVLNKVNQDFLMKKLAYEVKGNKKKRIRE